MSGAVPVCGVCLDRAHAGGEPDFAWRERAPHEPCGAADHDGCVAVLLGPWWGEPVVYAEAPDVSAACKVVAGLLAQHPQPRVTFRWV